MNISTSSSQPTSERSTGLNQALRQHPLFFFFLMSFVFSWLIAIPYVLAAWGVLPGDYTALYILRPYVGPALAAILMSRASEGREGMVRLRSRFRPRGVGWRWYLFVLLGAPALVLIGLLAQPQMLASFQGFTTRSIFIYPLYFFGVFFAVGLPEELGWRGFALPRMQQRYGPLQGTLYLGLLWGLWHLLYFLTPSHGGGPGTSIGTYFVNFSVFVVMVVALSVVLTWVYNHTQGSVLIASLLHTSIDTPQLVWAPLFLAVNEMGYNLAILVPFGILALLIILLTRGRLGYEAIQSNGLKESRNERSLPFVHNQPNPPNQEASK